MSELPGTAPPRRFVPRLHYELLVIPALGQAPVRGARRRPRHEAERERDVGWAALERAAPVPPA